MNALPDDLPRVDFVWSACALEHLGSLRHGLDFIVHSMRYLRPGGIALHTTELNLSSNDETLESPELSLYRWRDIEELEYRLNRDGHRLLPVNRHPGSKELDHYVDLPPYTRRHVKLRVDRYTITSLGLAIIAGPQ